MLKKWCKWWHTIFGVWGGFSFSFFGGWGVWQQRPKYQTKFLMSSSESTVFFFFFFFCCLLPERLVKKPAKFYSPTFPPSLGNGLWFFPKFFNFFFYFFGGYCSSSLGSLGIFLRQFVGKAIKILEAPRQMVFNDLWIIAILHLSGG